MSIAYTSNLGLAKPDYGTDPWSSYVNDNWDKLDIVFANVKYVNTIAALPTDAASRAYATVVLGYSTKNDGGGGLFVYDAAYAATNNGGTIFNGWMRVLNGLAYDPRWFGAIGNGVANDTTAMQAAITVATAAGGIVSIARGTYRVTQQLNLASGTRIIAPDGGATIVLDYSGASQNLFRGENLSNVSIKGLILDGGLDGTHVQGNCIVLVNCSNCEIEYNYIKNSPRESILIRDGSTKNKVRFNKFELQGGGSGQIYFLTNCTYNEASFNHFFDSAGGCVWLSGAVLHTKIIGNTCDQSTYELIGVRWDCGHGEIVGNTARYCGDNGISVTGYGWTVVGNTALYNDFAGIGIYGSNNTVVGNSCIDNGKAGGSVHGGLLLAAQFGGVASDNTISGNQIQRIVGASTEQYYGLRISSTSYTAWATGVVVAVDAYRTSSNRLYVAVTSGTTGATAPSHSSGDVSDGGVTWRYCGSFQNTNARPAGNRIGSNKYKNHTGGNIQRFGASPQNFFEEDENNAGLVIQTAWATGVAKSPGDVVYNTHSDNVARHYRATTAGTTGATAPTHTSGSVSDGGVIWYYLGQGTLLETETKTVDLTTIRTSLKLELIDSTANAPSITASTGAPEGVITAANGSLHLRGNSTAPDLYLKTDTTNTNAGWVAVLLRKSGTTANRPTGLSSTHNGYTYFDTTLGKPIWWLASGWVDGTGASV